MIIGVDGNEANVRNRVGSGQYAFELLKEFSKNKKHNFLVYLKEKPASDLPEANINFKYIIFGPKKFWTQFALPINLTFGKKLDVFFSPAHYGPRFSRVPYVVTIHDLSYIHFPELFKKNDLYQLTNWSKYSIGGSKHIIVPSRSTKDDLVKNYRVLPSKITVTYEGYDQSRFKPQPKQKIERIKKKYKIKGDYIVFVGTLQPRKNLERLIEAFSLLVTRHQVPDTSLVIVGKRGWLYDSIFQKVKDLKIEKNVIFTDFVPDEDLPALISGARLYVNPSLWEGFGIPVIEAQACGVPVVVSSTSSLPEIINPIYYPSSESDVASDESRSDLKNLIKSEESSRQVYTEFTLKVHPEERIRSVYPESIRGARTIINDAVMLGSGILVDPESVDSIASGIQKVLTDEKTKSDLVKKGFENIKRFSWETCAEETLQILESTAKL